MFSLMKTFGVNIYFSDKMMHGKGMIVDDDWAMVGSSNMDKTSFYDNYEANIHIKRKDVVKTLKDTVEKWLSLSSKFEELKWKQRGFWQKTKEWWAKMIYNWWHGDK
jgi:cardiolipin synthase